MTVSERRRHWTLRTTEDGERGENEAVAADWFPSLACGMTWAELVRPLIPCSESPLVTCVWPVCS